MNSTLGFMLKHIGLELGSLHWHTALLESCDWDEERKDALLVKVSELITELHASAEQAELNSPIILVVLRQKLRAIAGDMQIDILMNLLQAETALELGGMEMSNGNVAISQIQAEA